MEQARNCLDFVAAVFPDQGADGNQVGDVGHRFALALLPPVQISGPIERIDVALAMSDRAGLSGHGLGASEVGEGQGMHHDVRVDYRVSRFAGCPVISTSGTASKRIK